MKFEKDIWCDNCDARRTYRFERGTVLRDKRIECANCSVLIDATTKTRVAVKQGRAMGVLPRLLRSA